MKKMNPLNRLLRRNISAGQLIGYALANFVGLAIVLTALQFYRDVTAATNAEDSFISRDYLIISKKVEGLGSLGGAVTDFTPREIADIEAQPWAQRVGRFTAANFNVWAEVDFRGRRMSTSMFLEAIPSSFFDVTPPGWTFDPAGDTTVPIVISKDYLTLYNFGYAATHNMPQISESMVSLVPLRLSVSGNGRQQWFDARVVGFSSRLNTIAVPQEFIDYANGIYAEQPQPNPSRLIVELRRAGDPEATAYLDAHSMEAAGDKADSGRAAYFLTLLTTIVVIIGLIISALSFFILLLSIYLLLQKNREKIHRLMELGYTPATVSRSYIRVVVMVNAAVLLLAAGTMLAAHFAWSAPLTQLGATTSSPWISLCTGIVIMAFITLLNIIAIRRRVAGSFRE